MRLRSMSIVRASLDVVRRMCPERPRPVDSCYTPDKSRFPPPSGPGPVDTSSREGRAMRRSLCLFILATYFSSAAVSAELRPADHDVLMGWQPNGVPLVTAPREQSDLVVVADGQGGAIAAWTDNRNFGPLAVFLQRIGDNGQVVWPANGVQVQDGNATSSKPGLLLDGQGGVIVAWEENDLGVRTLRATRFLLDGSIAPGWPALGRELCQDPDC